MIAPAESGKPWILRAGAGSSGSIVLETDQSCDYQLKIEAGRDSRLKLIVWNHLEKERFGDAHRNHFRIESCTGENARIDLILIHQGGQNCQGKVLQVAKRPRAHINSDLVCLARGDEHPDFDLRHEYDAADTAGNTLCKAAATGRSHVGIKGAVHIKRRGVGAAGYLTQDCLLLSRKAGIKALPALQVDTDEVKAGHGASVSNFNDESLFYFESRGISRREAEQMMIRGFFGPVLAKLGDFPQLKVRVLKSFFA